MFVPIVVCMLVNSGLHLQQGFFFFFLILRWIGEGKDSGVLNKLVGVDLFNFLFEILVAELFTLEPSSLSVSSSDTDL